MKPILPVTIQYPKIVFWDIKAPVIQFINQSEFRLKEHLKLLGLEDHPWKDSFGCADRGEILRRQTLIKYLSENPKVADILKNAPWDFFHMPADGQSFMNRFGSGRHDKDGFWRFSRSLCLAVENSRDRDATVPIEIGQLVEFLKRAEADFFPAEAQMSKNVMGELSHSIVLSGTMIFTVDKESNRIRTRGRDKSKGYFLGYRSFSADRPPNPYVRSYRSGMGQFMAFFAKSWDRCKSVVHGINMLKWARPLFVREMSNEIDSRITQAVEKELCFELDEPMKGESAKFDAMVYYCFDHTGLWIRFIGASLNYVYGDKPKITYPSMSTDSRRYPRRIIRGIERWNSLISRHIKRVEDSSYENEFFDALKAHSPNIVAGMKVDIAGLSEISWSSSMGVIRSDASLSRVFDQAADLREFVWGQVNTLRSAIKIADCFAERAKEWGLKLAYADILDDRAHLVSFKKLIPIHLIGRTTPSGQVLTARDLAPIHSIGELNGTMIGLTGQNRGGKTVTEEEIAFLIYDAQSGFPCIGGEGVSLNVKNTIGMVFIERGQGSTMELMLQKMGAVVGEALKHPQNGTVVFLDELGTGTQEVSGAYIGEKVLGKLHESGCSVVFSTQIQQLALDAERKFGARCFAFDMDHNIRPGVDTGHPERIARELGVDRILGITG